MQKIDFVLFETSIEEIFKFKKTIEKTIVEKTSSVKRRRYAFLSTKFSNQIEIDDDEKTDDEKKTKNVKQMKNEKNDNNDHEFNEKCNCRNVNENLFEKLK